jgi:hypothetical protein
MNKIMDENENINEPQNQPLLIADVSKSACVNCRKSKEEHSKATELCPTRFAHFEQDVYCLPTKYE